MSNTLSATHALTRLGFDIPRFNFALRTALASALAMTLAWLIGLEHPQWSAMTVWAVSQPVRGMLLEKSFFRAIGTLIGTLFGIMLVMLCGDNLPLMVVGAAWVVTGWSVGAYVMLGVSVMIALFSNFETPYHIMGRIFWWQLAGAAAALSCHWLVWPQLHAEWQLVATLVPFLLVVALLFGHNRLNIGSIDYVMALLLLSHPVYPLSSSFNASLSLALAVVSGPLLAYLTFRTVWPADARRRRIHLTDMMLDEVSSMAAEERSSGRHAVWQARLYHRLLKLIQSVSRSGEPLPPVTSGALAVLAAGNAIQSLQQIRKAQPGTPTARRADLALQRLTRLRQQPAASAGTLRRLADHLQRQEHGAAWNIDNAARSIDANLEFFRSGALRT